MCGLSLGSLIAQQFAISDPAVPKKLILCGAHCHTGLFGSVTLGRIFVRYLIFVNKMTLRLMSTERYAALIASSVVRDTSQVERREEFARICMDISKDDFLKVMAHALTYDSVPNLSAIPCDTLVVYGEKDRIPRIQSDIFLDNIPRSRKVEISNARHVINYEKPDQFNRIVDDFLAQETG